MPPIRPGTHLRAEQAAKRPPARERELEIELRTLRRELEDVKTAYQRYREDAEELQYQDSLMEIDEDNAGTLKIERQELDPASVDVATNTTRELNDKGCSLNSADLEAYQRVRNILLSGTLAATGVVPEHTFIKDYPGHDWEDEERPPPGSTSARPGQGAWMCKNPHAYGNWYVGSKRKSCPACGLSQSSSVLKTMSWDLQNNGRGTGFVLFRRNTGWTPDFEGAISRKGTKVARGGKGPYRHFHVARLWAAMRHQFPMLSDKELQDYCSRPVYLKDLTETERLMNIIRQSRGTGQEAEASAAVEPKGRNIHDAIVIDDSDGDEF
ncbi:hypothetical protein C7974DRAFT_34543 [Boeremia exigua]|uniref:uncharacterized protein n=1 Tax=Boeremia exigua TaxID=749465 RepID=UPI001E8D1422|nr:uncharacterized protein C7974DRAFT_34543 [Boeremia exigua]KAH6618670.1 hypothetical protein C7974DRAFT_34543 [Boeremia exigua]